MSNEPFKAVCVEGQHFVLNTDNQTSVKAKTAAEADRLARKHNSEIHKTPCGDDIATVKRLMKQYGIRQLVDAISTTGLQMLDKGESLEITCGVTCDYDEGTTVCNNLQLPLW